MQLEGNKMSEEINHDRRRFIGTAAMTVAAVPFGVVGCAVQRMARAEAFAFTFG